MTADLVAFLRARLDETQDDAERGYLKAEPIPGYEGRDASGTAGLPPAVAARVLRGVEAKRAIVDLCVPQVEVPGFGIATAQLAPENEALRDALLRHLATEHSDHPDYKEKWRP